MKRNQLMLLAPSHRSVPQNNKAMIFLPKHWQSWRARRAMKQRIAALSEEERQAIMDRSPYELYYAQGEAVHLVLKAKRDLSEAMVDCLGECACPKDWRLVEDELIRRTLALEDHT